MTVTANKVSKRKKNGRWHQCNAGLEHNIMGEMLRSAQLEEALHESHRALRAMQGELDETRVDMTQLGTTNWQLRAELEEQKVRLSLCDPV